MRSGPTVLRPLCQFGRFSLENGHHLIGFTGQFGEHCIITSTGSPWYDTDWPGRELLRNIFNQLCRPYASPVPTDESPATRAGNIIFVPLGHVPLSEKPYAPTLASISAFNSSIDFHDYSALSALRNTGE